jgi:microcystin-dependent protein
MPDSHVNFAYSTVLTPPSPAASGLSLGVRSGDGAIFPLPSFNAIVCPVNAAPLVGNAEVVRVSGVASDTFTIARTQEGSNARAIQAGDQIYAAITAKSLTDIEALTPIGAIQMFGGATAPAGFLLCDGTTYLKTDYPALAAVLGTVYGGDSTHFTVPDMKGRVPMGAGSGGQYTDVNGATHPMTGRALGQKPGEEVHLQRWQESGTNGNGTTNTVNTDHAHGVSASGTATAATADGLARHVPVASVGGVQWSGFSPGSSSSPGNFPRAGNGPPVDSDLNHGHSVSVSGGTNLQSQAGYADYQHGHSLNSRDADWAANVVQPGLVLNHIIRAR